MSRAHPAFGRWALLVGLSALIAAAPQSAHADESGAQHLEPAALPAYPDRWCIEAFLEERRRAQPATISRRAPPRLAYPGLDLSLNDATTLAGAPDRSSLMNRLMQINANRLMTLWKGRTRSLVVGVQKGGYLGVSVDEQPNDQ